MILFFGWTKFLLTKEHSTTSTHLTKPDQHKSTHKKLSETNTKITVTSYWSEGLIITVRKYPYTTYSPEKDWVTVAPFGFHPSLNHPLDIAPNGLLYSNRVPQWIREFLLVPNMINRGPEKLIYKAAVHELLPKNKWFSLSPPLLHIRHKLNPPFMTHCSILSRIASLF